MEIETVEGKLPEKYEGMRILYITRNDEWLCSKCALEVLDDLVGWQFVYDEDLICDSCEENLANKKERGE